ncbi:MAG: pilus assembly protein PilM, partial [Phycisphaerales bacterium]
MAMGKSKLLICFGHSSVGVLEFDSVKANRSGPHQIRTRVARVIQVPSDVDPSSSREFGAWLEASLEQAGCKSKGAMLVLERSDVVAKRLHLEGIDRGDVELPGMVRYQLMRQVAFQTEDAPIDFMLLHPHVKSLKEVSGEAEVLAATAPAARVEHLKRVCEEAGLEVQRVGVFSLGLSVIAEAAMADRVGPTLVITPTLDGVDFSIYQSGRILSSRWIETQHHPVDQDLTELIVSEARRTRMSHQMAPNSDAIHSALVIADPGGVLGLAEQVATRVGDVLGVISEVIEPKTQAGLEVDGEWDSDRLLGLLGLVVLAAKSPSGRASQIHQLDLSNPLAATDQAAGRRQLVLGAILLLIVSLGGVRSYAGLQLSRMDAEIEQLREGEAQVRETYHRAVRDHAAAELVDRWQRTAGSPLEHLSRVTAQLPSNELVLLRSFNWSIRTTIEYPRQRNTTEYDVANWRDQSEVSVSLDLLAKTREIADAARRVFVGDPLYRV